MTYDRYDMVLDWGSLGYGYELVWVELDWNMDWNGYGLGRNWHDILGGFPTFVSSLGGEFTPLLFFFIFFSSSLLHCLVLLFIFLVFPCTHGPVVVEEVPSHA